MTKRSSPVGSDRGRRGPVREGYKVVALLKPNLGLFGLVGRRRDRPPHPGSATGHLIAPGDQHTLQHIQVHFGVDFQGGMMWPSLETTPKTITVARNFVFITLGTLNRPDLHFEGAVITWIGRDHVLYSGASAISLVEHFVTFRHHRRLLLLLGLVHNWPTSRWSATKKENRFSLNGNGITSSFLGSQFYRSIL